MQPTKDAGSGVSDAGRRPPDGGMGGMDDSGIADPATATDAAVDAGVVDAPRGALTVTVSMPDGVTSDIEVTGPRGYTRTLSATTTLERLVPGDYEVKPKTARKHGAIVDELYVASDATVEVVGDETATTTVAYALRPGTGRLWLPVMGSTKANGYGPGELATSGAAVTPGLAIGLGTDNRPYSAAVDRAGTLWLGTQGGKLFGFSAAQLASSGAPTPDIDIDTGSLDINDLAFDADGSLWMTAASDLRKLTRAQLASSGSPTPDVILTADASYPLTYPNGLAFDADGGLWVTSGNNTIYGYTPAQLAASGDPAPEVVLSDNAGSLATPRRLAFDASGNLWVANWNAHSVMKFSAAQLTSSGAPTPAVTLTGFVQPLGLAFDNGGNLWVSSSQALGMTSFGAIAQVAASNLVSSGAPSHVVDLADIGGFDSGGAIAFDPPPLGLPLQP